MMGPIVSTQMWVEGNEQIQRVLLALSEQTAETGDIRTQVEESWARALAQLAIKYTHVDTGSLRSAHHVLAQDKAHVVQISPLVINPESVTPPHEYGVYEHARGGDHAFYYLVWANDADETALNAADRYIRLLEGID